MVNLGNTCFMNSVLQSLRYSRRFYAAVRDAATHHADDEPCARKECTLCDAVQTIALLKSGSGRAVKPTSQLLKCISSTVGPAGLHRQEDAHEFARLFLEAVVARERTRQGRTSAMFDAFRGTLQTSCVCTVCRFESKTVEHFQDLSLAVRHAPGGDTLSLDKALNGFIAPELLDADNAYMCSKCKVSVRAEKRTLPLTLPLVLAVHLKRFGVSQEKIVDHVDFQEYLHVRCGGETKVFRLAAVIVHQGALVHYGHYYALVRTDEGWLQMDDSRVSSRTWDQVRQAQAYMLFYDQCEQDASDDDDGSSNSPSCVSPVVDLSRV